MSYVMTFILGDEWVETKHPDIKARKVTGGNGLQLFCLKCKTVVTDCQGGWHTCRCGQLKHQDIFPLPQCPPSPEAQS